MMVCTSETGIFEVAKELKRWPNNWNTASGMAVYSICTDGRSMPFFSAGMDLFRSGKTDATCAKMRHQIETEANCANVNVTGFGKAVKMDFEEVFVRAEVMYHAMQSA